MPSVLKKQLAEFLPSPLCLSGLYPQVLSMSMSWLSILTLVLPPDGVAKLTFPTNSPTNDASYQGEIAGTLRSPSKGDVPYKYPLYTVYMGLIIKGTIPRVPPFSL